MAKRKDVQKESDRPGDLLKDMPPERLKRALLKSRLLTMRITEADHEDIKRAAGRLGLTVTDYLLRLHRLVSEKLK